MFCFLTLQLQGCLKTRSQLRSESSDEMSEAEPSRRVASAPPVQDVKPQGEYVIEELKDEITRLSGHLEELEHQQKEFQKSSHNEKMGDELRKLEARISQLEKNQQAIQDSLAEFHEMAQSHQDPNEIFKTAKELFSEGRYQEAADQLAKVEKNSKAKNKDDATFLRGECFFSLKQFKKAVVEYSKFPEKYTHSSHYPEALYKIGLSFESMGMKEDAKGFYQELVEKFPKSPQAKKIRKKVK